MADRLAHKVALITGAGSGMGREMALLFAREGAAVVINDIDEEAGERTASEIGGETRFVAGDVSDDERWRGCSPRCARRTEGST